MKMMNTENELEVDEETMDEYCDKITLAAGVTAKDKRLKDAVSEGMRDENAKKTRKADKSKRKTLRLRDKKSGKVHETLPCLGYHLFQVMGIGVRLKKRIILLRS